MRDRSYGNNNRDSWDPSRPPLKDRPTRFSGASAGSRDGKFPSRGFNSGRGGGGRGGGNYNRSGQPPPPPPLPSNAPNLHTRVHEVIPPLVTFKTFMQFETEDLTPEEFQKRYDEYNLKYVQDFCEVFFNVSKSELWFQDRYNPLRFQELEQEAQSWATEEATRIKKDLESQPALVIKNMCLNKNQSKQVKQKDDTVSG